MSEPTQRPEGPASTATGEHAGHRSLPPGHRGMRLAALPNLSLVLASTGDRARLETCLATLVPACQRHNVELVVARNCPPAEYHDLANRYARALFMPAPDNVTSGVLRATGLSAADGDIVAFAHDGMDLDEAWVAELAARGVAATSA